ncbi:MAG TPA: N-acetylmuramoyl-L-alanine amidase [Methylomirabilota bacterium]
MTRARLAACLLLLLLCAGRAGAGLPTVPHEGRNYVELFRVAESLKSRLEASAESTQARLRTSTHVVTFTRNWARILVDGAPVVLDAPVRVRKGVWLVPETFVEQVVPRLSGVATAAAAPALPPTPPAPPAPAAAAITLEELRTRSYPSFTRIVVETSAPLTHRVEPGAGKEVRIRLPGMAGAPQVESIADGFIDEARLERAGADGLLRVTFEGAAGELRVSTLADPPRLVLDFARPAEPAARAGQTVAPLRTIVLDAGHGGHDSGAVGPGGLMEKELVLDVTRRVARLLGDRLGVKVLLSRDGDQFIPLRDRTSFANRERADLFVSIHANAHRVAASEGMEVYFLSSEATDHAARQLAAAENSVVQLEKPAPGRGAGRSEIVRTILWDLAQSEFLTESSRVAETVLDAMTAALRIPNRGVKQAGFHVLGGAAMPAILIEIGFVTNPREERRLKNPRYRDEIARAIFTGLVEYKRTWDERAPGASR